MITNKNYKIDLAKSSDKKMYGFAKETYFDEKVLGNKSTRDKSLIRLLESHAIIASGISTIFYQKIPMNYRWVLQEKQGGNISNIINEEIVAIADKLLEYKCKSTKQEKFLLVNV